MRLSATLRYCATGALSLIVTGVWARTGVATKPSPKTAANRGRQWRAFISRLAPGERRTLVLQHQRLEGTAAGPPPQPGEIAQDIDCKDGSSRGELLIFRRAPVSLMGCPHNGVSDGEARISISGRSGVVVRPGRLGPGQAGQIQGARR